MADLCSYFQALQPGELEKHMAHLGKAKDIQSGLVSVTTTHDYVTLFMDGDWRLLQQGRIIKTDFRAVNSSIVATTLCTSVFRGGYQLLQQLWTVKCCKCYLIEELSGNYTARQISGRRKLRYRGFQDQIEIVARGEMTTS